MKTLDEVIKAFEYTYENDPIAWTYGVDALYYLKEYQRYQNTPSRKGHMALVDYFDESQKNEPLTLEELKTMGGKPVWIEYIEEGYENEWVLVVKNPERPTFGTPTLLAFAKDGEKMYLTISGYGKRWKAYLKERK